MVRDFPWRREGQRRPLVGRCVLPLLMQPMPASGVAKPLAGAVVALCLSAGQTTPSPGSQIRAQVCPVPLTRQALERGAVLQLKIDGDPFNASRHEGRFPAMHGQFKAVAPAGQPLGVTTGVLWPLQPGDTPALQVRCRPVGGEPALVQAAYLRAGVDEDSQQRLLSNGRFRAT